MKHEIKQIPKQTSHAFGHKLYLLGVDKDNYYVWLQEPKWDCGWYWGFGYIERYTNKKHPDKSRDIDSHTHWKSGIVGQHDVYDREAGKFVKGDYIHHLNDNPDFIKSVLTENESWKLAELMETFYTLSKSAEMFGRGGSHLSDLDMEKNIVKREEWANEINEKILPEIFKEIDKLLGGENGNS